MTNEALGTATPSSATPPMLRLGDHLCYAIYSAGIAINRAYKPLLDALGITYPQYLVLLVLWEEGAQTVGGLADRLSLESSTLTPLLKRLEAAGYVTRERNPANERQVIVSLTGKGRALQQRSACVPATLLERSKLSVSELEELTGKVTDLRESVTAHG